MLGLEFQVCGLLSLQFELLLLQLKALLRLVHEQERCDSKSDFENDVAGFNDRLQLVHDVLPLLAQKEANPQFWSVL